MARLSIFGFAVLFLLAAPASAQPHLTVVLYDSAGLVGTVREALKVETSWILRQAGLKMEWLECEVAGRYLNHAECALPLGPTRLMLQLAPGRNPASPYASGFETIQGEMSVYACVYPARLKELAREANWEFGELLGHAAAHELGHLLLRSAAHTPDGVMRAPWEAEDLRKLSHAELIFLPGQLKPVQVPLASRLQ